MPEKRPHQEITEKDRQELSKVISGLKKQIKYNEPRDNYLILKDSCPKTTYPEPGGGEMRLSKEVDTHRVLLQQTRQVPKVTISSPEDVRKLVAEMADYDREFMKILYLDTKNRVTGIESIAEGSINAAIVHPRESVKGAVLANAAGIIAVHNHPSGVPKPSREDDVLIDRLIEAFGFLGIDVVDAIIIGKEGTYSYKESGKSFKPMLIGGIMESSKAREDDACTTSIRAAMETMQKYCHEPGKLVTDIIIGGTKLEITIPEEIIKIRADRTLTEEQRTNKIMESAWAHEEASSLCAKLFGQDTEECIGRVSRKLAEGMVRKGS